MDYGINLDAVSIRDEITQLQQYGALSEEDAKLIDGLTDSDLNDAIHDVVDDSFWEVYDRVRSNAIDVLLDRAR